MAGAGLGGSSGHDFLEGPTGVTLPPPGSGEPLNGQQPDPGFGPPQYGYGPGPGQQPGYGPQYGGQQYSYGPQPGYQPQWGLPPAPRPGSIPLRPLGVSDILDGTFRLIRRNPKVMLGLSAIVAVLQAVIVSGLSVGVFAAARRVNVQSTGDAATNTNLGPLLGSEGVAFIGILVSALIAAILTGMLTIAITQDVIGVRMGIGELWRRVRRRIWAIVGISLLITIVEAIGLLFCIAPGVWLWGIWAVAVPALMVEDIGVRKALGRSRGLVSGTFWRVWGIRALGTLMVSFAAGVLGAPFTVAGEFLAVNNSGSIALAIVLTGIGQVVTATLTAPVRAGIDALLYIDLRMRKEGLDIQLQMATQHLVAGPRPAPGSAF
jgi:hypothetical protein